MSDPRFAADALVAFATALAERSGVRADIARDVADVLVTGDLLGHTTHGLALLAPYLAEIEKGSMTKSGEPSIVNSRPAAQTWDGKRLPGRPRHELYGRLDLERRFGRGRRALGLWVDATFVAGNFLDAANLNQTPARKFLGAGARLEPWPGLRLVVEGKNLTDERVEAIALPRPPRPGLDEIPRAVADVLGYPLPGRTVLGTAELAF